MTKDEAKAIITLCIDEGRDQGIVKADEFEELLDFLDNQQPSLSYNLDEAAEDFVWEVMENDEDGISELSKKLRPTSKISDFYDALVEFFKAGAEWMVQQGVKAHCIESSNPVSENPNQRLHLITLLYEENEDTPYVVAGDDIEVILRKK